MKTLKQIALITIVLFASQNLFAQGCEDPGEGDGINFFGFIQPQYEYAILGKNGTLTKDSDKSSFYFNRARLGVLGNIPYDFSYYFIMEAAPKLGGASIMDAFISYNRFAPYARVSVGQFKAPFGAEQVQACHKLHTIHRSKVVEGLAGPIRDFGIMLSGSIDSLGVSTKKTISYNLAILNGEGRNKIDDNNRKSIVARLLLHPVNPLNIGVSYRYGKLPSSVAGEADNSGYKVGFDATVEYQNFLVTGELIKAAGTITTGGGCSGEPIATQDKEAQGYYVTALYKTPWNLEPVFKYESYDEDFAIKSDIKNAMTFGVNYFFNEWTRLQVNYVYNFEETFAAEIPNDRFMIQLQAIIK